MSNYLRLLCITLIFLLFSNHKALLVVLAEQIPEPVIISTFEDDLTGDSQHETVQLKGSLLREQSNYYQNVWLEIKSAHSEKWKIPFTGGYEPTIQLLDLNHDEISDVLYQSTTNKSDEFYFNMLYSLKNGNLVEIPLPEQSFTKGNFNNGFQIEIHTSIKNKPITIDVKDRANTYIKSGLYNAQGKLQKPSTIMISPIAKYEPILVNRSKGYGLKSEQKISDPYLKDILGTIETTWYYENGTWIILHTNWVPANSPY